VRRAAMCRDTIPVMTAIDLPVSTLHPRHRRALIGLLLAMFLGLLSLAAVREMRVECRDVYLTDDFGRTLLSDDGQRLQPDQNRQCRLNDGAWVPLPAWAQAIIAR